MGLYELKTPQRDLYILLDRVKTGPLTLAQVKEMFDKTQINRTTPLWYPGLLNWVTVGDIPDFNRRISTGPPPIPAAATQAALWIHFQEQVVAMTVDQIDKLVKDKKFRRGDWAYDAERGSWLRADQHPLLTHVYAIGVPIPEEKK